MEYQSIKLKGKGSQNTGGLEKRVFTAATKSNRESVGRERARKALLSNKEREEGTERKKKGKKREQIKKKVRKINYTRENLMTSASSRLENCSCRYAPSLAFRG